jgi:hypothetical protein
VCGLLACGGRAANKLPVIQDGPNVIGDWTGESICQVKNSPCHDEKVVYHVTRGKAADLVECSADKIVDGKAVNMGTLVFKYDKEAGTLVCDDHGHWQFTIKGNKMEGTLTLADGTLYRKIALTKN